MTDKYTCSRKEIVDYLYELVDHYWYWTETAFGLGEDATHKIDVFFQLICVLTEED